MTKTDLEKYLENPCSACATAFWKSQAFPVPKEIKVVHENDCKDSSSVAAIKYFKLLHNLQHINSGAKAGFCFQTVDLSKDIETASSSAFWILVCS